MRLPPECARKAAKTGLEVTRMLQYDENVIDCVIEVILVARELNLGKHGYILMVVEPSMDVDVDRKAILSGKKGTI